MSVERTNRIIEPGPPVSKSGPLKPQSETTAKVYPFKKPGEKPETQADSPEEERTWLKWDFKWFARALCAKLPWEVEFYPEKSAMAEPAKDICSLCPVHRACLTQAIVHREKHGVWGGTFDKQRARYITGLNPKPKREKKPKSDQPLLVHFKLPASKYESIFNSPKLDVIDEALLNRRDAAEDRIIIAELKRNPNSVSEKLREEIIKLDNKMTSSKSKAKHFARLELENFLYQQGLKPTTLVEPILS